MKGTIDKINEIGQIYSSRVFKIDNTHMYNEFNANKIKSSQIPALFHVYGKNEHVGIIERSNRDVKKKKGQ